MHSIQAALEYENIYIACVKNVHQCAEVLFFHIMSRLQQVLTHCIAIVQIISYIIIYIKCNSTYCTFHCSCKKRGEKNLPFSHIYCSYLEREVIDWFALWKALVWQFHTMSILWKCDNIQNCCIKIYILVNIFYKYMTYLDICKYIWNQGYCLCAEWM